MTTQQIEEIKKQAVIDCPELSRGGQHHNGPVSECRLVHEELSFSITISYFRSYSANKAMCITLFELFLSDL